MIDSEDLLRVRTVVTVLTSTDGDEVTSVTRVENVLTSIEVLTTSLTTSEVSDVVEGLTTLGFRSRILPPNSLTIERDPND